MIPSAQHPSDLIWALHPAGIPGRKEKKQTRKAQESQGESVGLGLVHHGAEQVLEHQTAYHGAYGEVIEGMGPVSS